MNRLLAQLPQEARATLRRARLPRWSAPMLATLTDERFSDPDWLYERKLDGERCIAFRDGRGVRLLSRNRKRLNDSYPEIAEALRGAARARFVVDGEVVAFERGHTSFGRLQQRMKLSDADAARASGVKVTYYLFDLLHLDGYDVSRLPLATRKRLLHDALSFADPLRYTAHRRTQGERFHAEACRKGWEGVIAKRADQRYVHHRSRAWLKFKCVRAQELVIGGYTDPGGSRSGLGALLVGFYHGKRLHYAGKVGTGYDRETLRRLARTLSRREQEDCPFEEAHAAGGKGVHWVRPSLVAQIGFTEWTRADRLRHPRFLGLRRDKPAGKVVKEGG